MKRMFVLCAVAFAMGSWGSVWAQTRCQSFQGESPPELRFQQQHWINGEPVTLAGLRGKVVWLQFNF